MGILIEDGPADSPHHRRGFEIFFPYFISSEIIGDSLKELSCFVNFFLSTEVFKIVFMEPHPVELPPKPSFQFSIFGRTGLSLSKHLVNSFNQSIGLRDITLIEREVVF